VKKYDVSINSTTDRETSDEKLLDYISPNSTVLEFGPAHGRMTQYMKEILHCKVYIVELDPDGYERAIGYADGGICGDILDFSWLEAFKDISFDYILFGDVLEHLIKPKEALEKSVSLLKDSGSVIVSVPNIAHSAIIINLINNKFEYTPLGLLDETHVHFFTHRSLIEMLDSCGLIPVIEDGTICLPENTEQGASYDDLWGNTDIIKGKEFSNVYQFVFRCLKRQFYFENKKTYKIKKLYKNHTPFSGNLYPDTGNGFNPNEALSIPLDRTGNNFVLFADIPSNVKGVRIDPGEGKPCIINDMQIVTDRGAVNYTDANGIEINNVIIFDTIDPQIKVDFKGIPVSKIKISGSIYEFSFDDIAFLSKIRVSLEKERIKARETADNLARDLSHYQTQHHAAIDQRDALQAQINTVSNLKEAADREILALRETADNLARDLSHYQTHYHAAIAQRDTLQVRVNTIESDYQAILNSEFWRMTKPLRVLLNLIKYILKHTPLVKYVYKFLFSIKYFGLKETFRKTKRFLRKETDHFKIENTLPETEIKFQKSTRFSRNIKFSILVPLYNTPEKFLKEMIASVKEQTYENWELCLVDGSDKKHSRIRDICKNYTEKDSRILYRRLGRNLGISGNTNECITMSSGEYIALLDHDDLLHPSALYEVMKIICKEDADVIYTDEDKVDADTRVYSEPHFKPDFAIDNLRANNYICHLLVFKKYLFDEVGMFNSIYDGSQDHDMILRLVEKAEKIVHIPKILYHWRINSNSTSLDVKSKPYVSKSGIDAVSSHLKRCGIEAEVTAHKICQTLYRIKYKIVDNPLVSIVIPNKDHAEDLRKCVNSIMKKTTYSHYEIIIVENGSITEDIFNYYEELKKDKIWVVYWDGRFNFSEINNFGRKNAHGDYIVLLNNDIEIISPDWIEEMLMLCQRRDIGAVGAKLYYPDDTIQHGGVIGGIGGIAGHAHKYFPRSSAGYFSRLLFQQDLSAVTAACMMVKMKVFDEIGGLDPLFAVAFNDVDFCMRIRKAGYLIAWTPYAEAYHYESKSRGLEDTPEKQTRFSKEISLFQNRWAKELALGDPYYNPNLTLDREDFSPRVI
jgi:GT2 family glycosyltransferase